MDAQSIIAIIGAVVSAVFVTIIPSIITIIKKAKEAKEAKTEAERQAIYNEMYTEANKLIAAAEETYKQVDSLLKQQSGTGAGAVKKDSVMSKLQSYCTEKGLTFDSEYWSEKIDEIVAMTKTVNAKS